MSEFLKKQIKKRQVPDLILEKLLAWMESLRGKLFGLRSIRLSRGWRAYYRIEKQIVEWVVIKRIDKHEY